ncbi:transketolase family protein [Vibrio sp. MEBiC08052]|uniref:transketolase family protein n=1 Tax=Vibrio sp. MEBiC08052 TaxID=1761910 RepID=UPI0007405C7A|nr:transketolase C-terminal domain-containing protein [Vibrio sp. MEBiC08052]KUJ00642.1 transketolase [Vibrio sp. MEBiC08052]
MNNKPIAMRDALLEKIWHSMKDDPSIFFVTADFGSPVLDKIRADFPERFKNVGIAEQNLINVASGLALEGFKVFAYAIAPFITMRCYEQLRVCLALLSKVRKINVNLIGVGAGYSYVVSGPTHQCYEDLTLIRSLANFQLFSPSDHLLSSEIFAKCIDVDKPKYIRLDAQVLPQLYENQSIDLDKGFNCLTSQGDVVLVATGYMVHTALKVAHRLEEIGVSVAVIDLFDIQDCDESSLIRQLQQSQVIISMEEGFRGRGGVDARIGELLRTHRMNQPFLGIGVEPDYRFELGKRDELHEQVGIGTESVFCQIRDFLKINLEYRDIAND